MNAHTRKIQPRWEIGKRKPLGLSRLVVANTRFQHPKKHPLTWYSIDDRTADQIDYILARSRWSSSMGDCGAYRGDKTGTDDILERLKLNPSTRRKIQSRHIPNMFKLTIPDEVQALSNVVTSKLTGIDGDGSLDELRTGVKLSIARASVEQLGKTKWNRKDWVSAEIQSVYWG